MLLPDRKITLNDIKELVDQKYFFTANQGVKAAGYLPISPDISGSLCRMTFCVLVLKNGYVLQGSSACADPRDFNAELGQQLAEADALNKAWPLLGFMRRDKLAMVEAAHRPSFAGMTTHVGEKVVHAKPMTREAYNAFRGWKVPDDENPDDAGYLIEYGDGQRSNFNGSTGYISWSPADVFERAYGEPMSGSR